MTDPDTEMDAITNMVANTRKKGRPPGIPGKANKTSTFTYVCDICGKVTDREKLYSRQVRFLHMITKKQIKARIVDWVCDSCLPHHPDFVRKSRQQSPGWRYSAKEQNRPLVGSEAVRRIDQGSSDGGVEAVQDTELHRPRSLD